VNFEVGFCPTSGAKGANYIRLMNTREMKEKVTDRVQDFQKKATETARNLTDTTDQYIRDNTWSSIACAALLGCVIGYLLSGRRD
jgi:ElaB/YqjD/DUF883 family membrane-anchored ribosome-binding protein